MTNPTTPDALAHARRNWRDAVGQGFRVGALVAILLEVLFALWPLVPSMARFTPVHMVGVAAWLVSWVVTTGCLVARRCPAGWLVLQWGLLAAGHAVLLTARPLVSPGDRWSVGYWYIPLMILVAIHHDSRRTLRLQAGMVATAVGLEVLGYLLFWRLTGSRLIDETLVVYPGSIIMAYTVGLLLMAEQHDERSNIAREASRAHADQRTEHDGRREAARLLHDHVLHALHAIASPREHVTVQDAVEECAVAIEVIDQPAERAGMLDLRALLLADPTTDRLAAPVLGQVEPIPAGVATTIASAAHEALVNVERHARARSCRVELSSHGEQGCEVRIVDDGRGFDTTQNSRGRLGLKRSVVERLDDIGGQAEVISTPGAGTVVILAWPRRESPLPLGAPAADPAPGPQADLGSRRMMSLMAAPGLVLTTVMCVLAGPQMPHFQLSGAVTMLCMAVGAWYCVRLVHRPLSNAGLWSLLGLTALAWLVNLLTTPRDESNVYMLWMSWGAASMTQLVMMTRPPRTAARIGIGMVVMLHVSVLAHFGLRYGFLHFVSGGNLVNSLIVLIAYQSLYLAQTIARAAARQQQLAELTRRDTARLSQRARLEQFWSARVTQEVLPLLRSVATGELDARDDRVRQLARAMESSLRDELLLGPGEHGLGEHLARLRHQGWQVHSTLTSEEPPGVLGAAARIAALLGPARGPGQVLTLSSNGTSATAVVLGADEEQACLWRTKLDEFGGMIDSDPDFLRMAVEAR